MARSKWTDRSRGLLYTCGTPYFSHAAEEIRRAYTRLLERGLERQEAVLWKRSDTLDHHAILFDPLAIK